MRSLLLAVALAAAGWAGPAAAIDEPAPPRIYRWVDENGIAHYTTDPERIPRSLLRRFGLPAEPLAREPLDARAPSPLVPTVPGRDPDAWAAEEKSTAPAVEAGPLQGSSQEGLAETLIEASTASSAAASPGDQLAQLELRIAELSASIAADEDALSAFIGTPDPGDTVELADKPEFRAIAVQLPKRLDELAALRSERDALRSDATP